MQRSKFAPSMLPGGSFRFCCSIISVCLKIKAKCCQEWKGWRTRHSTTIVEQYWEPSGFQPWHLAQESQNESLPANPSKAFPARYCSVEGKNSQLSLSSWHFASALITSRLSTKAKPVWEPHVPATFADPQLGARSREMRNLHAALRKHRYLMCSSSNQLGHRMQQDEAQDATGCFTRHSFFPRFWRSLLVSYQAMASNSCNWIQDVWSF